MPLKKYPAFVFTLIYFFFAVSISHLSPKESSKSPAKLSEKVSAGSLWWYATKKSFQKPEYWSQTLKTGDTICVTGHVWKRNGALRLHLFPQARNLVRKKKLRLFPLLSPGNYKNTKDFLISKKAQKKFIKNAISQLSKEPLWSGLHLDMEHIPKVNQKEWIGFLVHLRNSLAQANPNYKLSLAVFPNIDFDRIKQKMHDPRLLRNMADEVVLMAYDYHGTDARKGPVSSYSWIQKNILFALRFYKPKQLWLGLPLYGYAFRNNKSVVVSRRAGLGSKRLQKFLFHGHSLPSDIFLKRAIEYAAEKELRGVAFWRAGFESANGL